MIELLNIQATNKDGRVMNYKEVRMIHEYGKMTIKTERFPDDIVAVYSYDHPIIFKDRLNILICVENLTKKRNIKHIEKALELLYKGNEKLHQRILIGCYAVQRFCEIYNNDSEFNTRLYGFLDGIGLDSRGILGKVWLRIKHDA